MHDDTVFAGGPGTAGPAGARTSGRARFAVDCDRLGGREIGLYHGDPTARVRQAVRDAGERAGLRASERERLKVLERENLELRRANEILRKTSSLFAQAKIDRKPK